MRTGERERGGSKGGGRGEVRGGKGTRGTVQQAAGRWRARGRGGEARRTHPELVLDGLLGGEHLAQLVGAQRLSRRHEQLQQCVPAAHHTRDSNLRLADCASLWLAINCNEQSSKAIASSLIAVAASVVSSARCAYTTILRA